MILIKPSITEKSIRNNKNNCYVLIVNINSNKIRIKKEVEKKFGFLVKNVRTMVYPRKDKSKYTKKGFLYGKTNKIKKAIIQFDKSQEINFIKKNEKSV